MIPEDEPREGGPGRHGADGRSPFLLSTETCVATEGTQEWFTVNGEFSEGKCALFGKCRIFGLRPKILTLGKLQICLHFRSLIRIFARRNVKTIRLWKQEQRCIHKKDNCW